MYDMELVDLIPEYSWSSSKRYIIGHKGQHKINQRVEKILANEINLG